MRIFHQEGHTFCNEVFFRMHLYLWLWRCTIDCSLIDNALWQEFDIINTEGHNTPLGYHTDQGPKGALSMMSKGCIVN